MIRSVLTLNHDGLVLNIFPNILRPTIELMTSNEPRSLNVNRQISERDVTTENNHRIPVQRVWNLRDQMEQEPVYKGELRTVS